MTNYLLLEDGSLFYGNVIEQEKNILGAILLNGEDNITINCEVTGKSGLVVNSSSNKEGFLTLSDEDYKTLKLKLTKSKYHLAKIVTDSLPTEFHIYDLKTFVTSGLQ